MPEENNIGKRIEAKEKVFKEHELLSRGRNT